MRPTLSFLALLASLVVVLLAAPAARADIPSPPSRPLWDDPPAPLPEPPDEGAPRWLVALGVVAAASGAVASYRLRARPPARVSA